MLFEGVTSNTDAAHLAEFFAEAKCPTKVPIFFFDTSIKFLYKCSGNSIAHANGKTYLIL